MEGSDDRKVAAEGDVGRRAVAEDHPVGFVEGIDPDKRRRGVRAKGGGSLEVRDHFVGDFRRHLAPGAVDTHDLYAVEGAKTAVGGELAKRGGEVDVVRRAVPAVQPRVVAEPLVGGVEAQR